MIFRRKGKAKSGTSVDVWPDDAATILQALQTLKKESPLKSLKQAASLALEITATSAKRNKNNFKELANDSRCLVYVIHRVNQNVERVADMPEHLNQVIKVLREVKAFAEKASSRNKLKAIVRSGSDSSHVQEYQQKLQQCLGKFGFKEGAKLEVQALKLATQYGNPIKDGGRAESSHEALNGSSPDPNPSLGPSPNFNPTPGLTPNSSPTPDPTPAPSHTLSSSLTPNPIPTPGFTPGLSSSPGPIPTSGLTPDLGPSPGRSPDPTPTPAPTPGSNPSAFFGHSSAFFTNANGNPWRPNIKINRTDGNAQTSYVSNVTNNTDSGNTYTNAIINKGNSFNHAGDTIKNDHSVNVGNADFTNASGFALGSHNTNNIGLRS